MSRVLSLRFFMAYGGRRGGDNFTTTLGLRFVDDAPSVAVLEAAANTVRVAISDCFLTDVHFMRAVFADPRAKDTGAGSNDVWSFEMGGTGQRPRGAAEGDALPLNVALGIKMQAEGSRGGLNLFRGCLAEADVTGNGANEFNLVGNFAQAQGKLNALLADKTVFEIVQFPRKDYTEAKVKAISKMTVARVITKRRDIRSKKKAPSTLDGILEYADEGLSIVMAAAGALLAKRAGLTPAAIAMAAAKFGSIGAAVGSVVESLALPAPE